MKRFLPLQLAAFGILILILFGAVTAIAATNTVPPTRLDHTVLPIGINDLKPSACAGIYVATLVTGMGTISGTEGNDLILGSSGTDIIDGLGGNDCILGGGGDDSVDGGEGSDICLGGPGADALVNCEGEIQ